MPTRTRLGSLCCIGSLFTCFAYSGYSYDPLEDQSLTIIEESPLRFDGTLEVLFLGNTTLYITDGTTHLITDAFISRPNKATVLFGELSAPDPDELKKMLNDFGVNELDAILVGHSHYDHALDAPYVAKAFGAEVMGSDSYGNYHIGTRIPEIKDKWISVPCEGRTENFGKFTVTFVKSKHVTPKYSVQKKLEGQITEEFSLPARNASFKTGYVFVIHISHENGRIIITTTAGAKEDALDETRHKADVVFLGIGTLAEETEENQKTYWNEIVGVSAPDLVIPTHWDDFTRKLDRGLKPRPMFIDDLEQSMEFVKSKAEEISKTGAKMDLQLMDIGSVIRLEKGKVLSN
ncbi:MAG: MBL fold metallo-hydrolase [Verrucomicrobiota bacterium]